MSGHFHDPLALPPSKGRPVGVGGRACLDVVAKRKAPFPAPYQKSNPSPPTPTVCALWAFEHNFLWSKI